jgi:hypothetical protein
MCLGVSAHPNLPESLGLWVPGGQKSSKERKKKEAKGTVGEKQPAMLNHA